MHYLWDGKRWLSLCDLRRASWSGLGGMMARMLEFLRSITSHFHLCSLNLGRDYVLTKYKHFPSIKSQLKYHHHKVNTTVSSVHSSVKGWFYFYSTCPKFWLLALPSTQDTRAFLPACKSSLSIKSFRESLTITTPASTTRRGSVASSAQWHGWYTLITKSYDCAGSPITNIVFLTACGSLMDGNLKKRKKYNSKVQINIISTSLLAIRSVKFGSQVGIHAFQAQY